MGKRTRVWDGLRNLVSGLGGANDKAKGVTYQLAIPARPTIDACYRSTWLGRKIHDIPALDMTREWRGWQAEDDQIEAIENEEKRLQLRIKVRRAIVLAKLYGGSALIMGLPGDAAKPAPEKIGKGQLTYLHLVHRHQLSLGDEIRDLTDPLFGRPQQFMLTARNDGLGAVPIHPSRVIAFTGNQLPDGSMGAGGEDWFWGDPLLASIFDALTGHDTGVAAISSLLNEAKTDIVHIPGLMDNLTTAEYERELIERFTLASLLKSITNVLLLDGGDGTENSGERWEQRQIVWEGLPDVQRTLFQLVAGAADIPATRLIGMSPTGMNATGESDTRNYYDMLSSLQNSDVTPVLAPLDERLIMSATGARDPAIFYDWRALWQMSPKDKAERDKMVADTAEKYSNMGVVPDDALAVAVQNRLVEDSVFPGLEAALEEAEQQARLELPPEERGATGELPEAANDPNPEGPPSGKQAALGKGRGSATITMAGNSKRRAANDRARRYVADRGGKSTLLLTDDHLLDDEGGQRGGFFSDFNPHHVESGPDGGQFTSGGGAVAFEVAPDPDNKELLERWNKLSDAEKQRITDEMTAEFVPQITERMGVEAELFDAVGGYQGQINPSLVLTMDNGNPFEVAGAIGDVFDQKAMVVMMDGPGAGVEAVGAIRIAVPTAKLRQIQSELGDFATGGWTHQNGHLELLNFSGKSDVEYATAIDQRLGGRYRVEHTTIYSALVERNDYVSPQSDREGVPWGQVAGDLRQSFAGSLAEKIEEKAGGTTDQAVTDYSPTQPRDPGGEGGGQWIEAGGVAMLTSEAKADMARDNAGKDIDQLRREAAANQARLEEIGAQVGTEAGVEFHGPPPDSAIKSAESIARKVRDEGYDGPHQLRDISRAMFVVDTPQEADVAVLALSEHGRIYDGGWRKQERSGYLGRYAFMQHANGGVSEIQFIPRGVLQVRNEEGHRLYEIMRLPTIPLTEREAAAARSRELYGAALTEPFKAI